MKKVESLVVVVELTDGTEIESDEKYREEILLEMKKEYPNERESVLEENLDKKVEEFVELVSQIAKLNRMTLMVDGYLMAINPTLIKTIHFKIDYQE